MPAGRPNAANNVGRPIVRICRSRRRPALAKYGASWLSAGAAAMALLWPPAAQAWDALRMTRAAAQLGPAAVSALGPLQGLLRSAAAQTDRQRVLRVNGFYNQRIAFATDRDVWGQDDYWASPLQMLAQGRGDCEDYAIAKYATLLAVGVAPEQLQLVYVRARLPGQLLAQPHMVLTWQSAPDADPLVLDNLRTDALPAAQRTDLTPLFSFNAEGLWLDSKPAGDPMSRLSRWRDVWLRTREEGFP